MTSRSLPTLRDRAWALLLADDPRLAGVLSASDWDRIDATMPHLRWEHQERGDIAEHSLDVAMLVTNRPAPAVVSGAAEALVAFFTGRPRLELFSRLLGRPARLHLRRAQINRMSEGARNPFHRDTDDDPDYVLGALLYPCDPAEYEGGEICFEGADAPLKPPWRSLVVFRADVGHALRPVARCRRPRLSIVLLFGEHSGDNRRFCMHGRAS